MVNPVNQPEYQTSSQRQHTSLLSGFSYHPLLLSLTLGLSTAGLSTFSQQTLAADKPDFDYDAYTRSVEETQERQMQQLIQSSRKLNQQVSQACAKPAKSGAMKDWSALPALQAQWLNTSEQWQKLQVFPLGPNTDVTVRLNISFWPDKKNLVERKAKTMLQQGKAADLKNGGISLQGLTASEYLLFDPGHLSSVSSSDTCHLLTQITAQSQNNAEALLTRWQQSEFYTEWHDAALGNDTFASTTQAAGYLIAGLAETLEAIAKNKVYKPFRLNDEKALPNAYLAENWRSNQSLTNLATNFTQIRAYYLGLPANDAGKTINGPDQLLRHQGFAGEADQIVAQLNQNQQTLATLVKMGSAAYLSAEGKAQAEKLHQEIKLLERALKKPLPHFQLTQRFNSADGD